MLLRVPAYYKEFRCIANRCKDSCCVGWEIDIDEDTFEYYQTIEGAFGERLRKNIKAGEDNCFQLEHRRCPFLNQTNLCDICIELGEEALCEVCTEYPRFTMEYREVTEKCMALSCEEVGRLVFQSETPFTYEEMEEKYSYDWDFELEDIDEESENVEEVAAATELEELDNTGVYSNVIEGEEDEPTQELVDAVEAARETVFAILKDRTRTIEKRIAEVLEFSEQMQTVLKDGNYIKVKQESDEYMVKWHLKWSIHENSEGLGLELQKMFEQRMEHLKKMEVLDEEWRHGFAHVREELSSSKITNTEYQEKHKKFMKFYRSREYEYEHLMNYFIFRYFMRAVYDYDFLGKVKLAVVSFLCIRDFDVVRFYDQGETFELEDRIDLARIYSKEVEHSDDNVQYLSELFEFEPLYQTENLVKMLE